MASSGSVLIDDAANTGYRLFRGDALEECEHAYRYLWERTDPRPPTLDFDWVRTWWDLHRAEGQLFVVQLERDGKPVGLAPLYIRHRETSARGVLRTVCFLSTGEDDADEVYGTNNGWLGVAPAETTVAVAAALRAHRGAWDRLWLSNMAPHAALGETLRTRLGDALVTSERHDTVNWLIELPESLDDYIDANPKGRWRTNMRGTLRRAEEAGLTYEWVQEAEAASAAYEELAELHTRQWQERGEPGACASPVFDTFQRRMIERYVAQGRLWLLRISYLGEPVGVSYDLQAGTRLYSYLSGVNLEYKRFSPGKLALLKTIERATAAGLDHYDLLAGDYGYKHRFATREMPVATLEAYGRSPAARAWLALRRLKNLAGSG